MHLLHHVRREGVEFDEPVVPQIFFLEVRRNIFLPASYQESAMIAMTFQRDWSGPSALMGVSHQV